MWTGIRKHCATALRCDKKQLAVLSMLLVGGAWSNQALAALDIKVAKEYDGTRTCALDANAQNNLLCTNDEARYKVDYQVTPPPVAQENVRITVSLPATEPFRFSRTSGGLTACRNAATAISNDGRTVDCLLAGSGGANQPNGPISNQSGTLFFDVYTNKDAKNGDQLAGVTGKIVSDQDTAGVTSTAPGVTVVAKPQIDIVKRYVDSLGVIAKPKSCDSAASDVGVALRYSVALNIPQTKGHESLQQGWSYTDDISGLGADACVYMVESYRERNKGTFPVGGVPADVPVDAGTGSYSFARVGNSKSVTVTASTTNPPLTSGEITAPWPDAPNATALHYITVWVPKDTANSNGTTCQYSPQNSIEKFTAQGLSGVPNDSDDPANNVVTTNGINVCSGNFQKMFYATSKGRSAPLINGPNRMSNDLIGPSDYIDSYVFWSNTGLNAAQVSLCDHWDNRKLQLDLFDPSQHGIWTAPPGTPRLGANSYYKWKKLPANSNPGKVDYSAGYAHFFSDTGAAGGASSASVRPEDEEIQFGFSAFDSGDETKLRNASCNDGDSTLSAVAAKAGVPTTGILPSGWITQSELEKNPALVPFINSARVVNANIPVTGRIQLFVHLKTLAANPEGGATWPNGTIIPNYGLYQTSTENGFAPDSNKWKHSERAFMGNDPNAALEGTGSSSCQTGTNPARYCDDGYSDRLRLSTQSVSIRKGIEGADPVGGPAADNPAVLKTKGQVVTYQLWPRLVPNDPNVTIKNDLVLIDTIPAGMKFVPGSLKWGGTPVAAGDFHLDDQSATFGASTLHIRLPNQDATNPPINIPVVEFEAQIMLDAPGNIPNASLINQVEIRGCAPGASLTGGTLTCTNQTAGQRLAERQAMRTVRLGAIDGLVVQKSVIGDAAKQIGSSFTMELRYQNVGNETVHEHRLIDVLPYNGEPPRGGTSFSGQRPVTQVRAPAATGYQVYYTTDLPTTINTNPKCASNITVATGNWPAFAPGVPAAAGCANNSGSTTWVLATQAGANWTVPANTTALLMKDTEHFGSGAPSRAFQLDFNTPGSRHDDVYANNFSGAHGSAGTAAQEGTGARFDVTSNNVQVRVYASSIQGTVFVDPDANGAATGFDPTGGDTGLGGQTVTLRRTGMPDRTAVTATAAIAAGKFYNPTNGEAADAFRPGLCPVPASGLAAGQYLFCDLEAGQYTLVETQPADYETTGNKAGTAGGTVTGDTISAIDLPADNNATGYDFGERKKAVTTTVSGRVYVEGNGNNADNGNATDPGIGGVTVTLTYTPPGGGATVSLTKTTAADGSYAFNDLPVGATNVTITETQPANYVNIYNTPGSNGAANGDNNPGATTDSVITIATLAAGGSQGNNFAEQRQTTSVAGRVYVEGNSNTTDNGNATDPGIGGVTVTLTYTPPGGGTAVSLTKTTGADGSYEFTNITVGATGLTITETQPANYVNIYNTPGSNGAVNGGDNAGTTTDSVITIATLAAGGSQGNNFAEQRQTTSVAGRVYREGNGNTADDGNATDPGINGVTVTLRYTPPGGAAPVEVSVTTGADGSYSFNDLPVGATNVTITETQPTGYENAYNTPGNGAADGGGGTPGTTANSVITIATLPAGGSTGNNFAERGADTDLTSAIACTVSGSSATCELTCTNNGPSTALNATCGFTSALPSGVTVSCTPNSPQATLAVGESIVCKTSPFPVPSSPLDVRGGTGADNDSKGGTDPAAGNNPSRTTLGAPAPSTVPVPTLGLGGVLLLALALLVAVGLRRRVA